MFISEFKTALPYLLKARVTPFVWGVHGIGKTSCIKQVAAEGGHKLFTLALGNVEIPDLLGIMDTNEDQYTGKRSARYLIPEYFQQLITFAETNPDKYAIVFLDELNHARKDVLSPVFQMVLENSLHATKFPDNFRFIVASNPPTEDYAGVLNLRNQAFLDRFCHIKIEPNAKGWLEYANDKVNSDILGFINDNPDHLRMAGKSFSVDTFCSPSERSWEAVNRLYELGAPKELIYGMVGISSGQAFYSWMAANKAKTISGADILAYTPETQALVQTLVKEGRWAEVQKCVDNLAAEARRITHDLHEFYVKDANDPRGLGKDGNGGCSEEERDAVIRFLGDLPDEVYQSAFQLIAERIECRYIVYNVYKHPTQRARVQRIQDEAKKAAETEGEQRKQETAAPAAPAKKRKK